jgi:hypothetical protein
VEWQFGRGKRVSLLYLDSDGKGLESEAQQVFGEQRFATGERRARS